MVAGDEAGQRLYTAILVQRVYLSIGTLVRDIFLDKQMAVGQCSDLRRMSDAEDLMALGALTQYLADTAGCFARYAAVDLVVNNGRHGVFISHCVFNGKGNTAQLTARGDLCQRLRSFAGVCGDIELDAVLPMAGQRAARMAKRHPHTRHVQEVQR